MDLAFWLAIAAAILCVAVAIYGESKKDKNRERMTLQQLKYVITVAETGTITEAANRLYVSQPSLTNAIHELEKEMNIVIFNRTNKGITLSKEGDDFLGYARQVLEQAAILEDKYKGNPGGKNSSAYPPSIIPLPSTHSWT